MDPAHRVRVGCASPWPGVESNLAGLDARLGCSYAGPDKQACWPHRLPRWTAWLAACGLGADNFADLGRQQRRPSLWMDACIWTWVWMHPSSDNAAARRSAEKVRGRICRKSRVLLPPPPPPPPAIPLPKRQRRLLLACLEGRGLTNILGAVMCVSEELLCSFELLKPLDASALKQHMKKGDSKKQ